MFRPTVLTDMDTMLRSSMPAVRTLRAHSLAFPVVALARLSDDVLRDVLGEEDIGVDGIPRGGAGHRDLSERSVRDHIRSLDLGLATSPEFSMPSCVVSVQRPGPLVVMVIRSSSENLVAQSHVHST